MTRLIRCLLPALASALALAAPVAAQGLKADPKPQETKAPAKPALPSGPCERIEEQGAGYVVCTVDLTRYEVRLFWKDEGGEAYGSLRRLTETRQGKTPLAFSMNAGMYRDDLAPLGLYVEEGRELRPVSTTNGSGNFHLKPNGIFYVHGETAGILTTERYLALKPKADFATQSGPMLVIGGRLHPKISEKGTSQKRRNGVGLVNRHTLVFAISDGPVTFAAFAHLFRDRLGAQNALFLDGSISSLSAPNLERSDWLYPVGPIVGALPRKAKAGAPPPSTKRP